MPALLLHACVTAHEVPPWGIPAASLHAFGWPDVVAAFRNELPVEKRSAVESGFLQAVWLVSSKRKKVL
jgi:hypothetical protein